MCLCYIIYRFACGSCIAIYCSETCHHFEVRVSVSPSMRKHSDISPLMSKQSKSKKIIKKLTAFKNHILMCDDQVCLDDFKVLAFSISGFHLEINESSFLISRDQTSSGENETSLPLY